MLLAYDANGNTLTDAQGRSFTWDFENRLTQAVVPGQNGGTTTFKYDPFGRRIQKSGPPGTTNYVYDGFSAAEETDGSGNFTARYVSGPSLDEPFAQSRGVAASYYQADAIGSITSLDDPNGSGVGTYAYDSYGRVVASSGTVTNAYRFTGREFDAETGLYFYRARYYDQNLGRFINEDRIRFRGGVDFYWYTRNSPTDLRDPSGNEPPPPTMVQTLLNILPDSELLSWSGGQYILVHRPCPEVARLLEAQGFETGFLPPFVNPFDHAGGLEFRTRGGGGGPGLHFRMPSPPDPTEPLNMGGGLSPCPPSNCVLDQFHIDPHNPLGGDQLGHFEDFLNSHGITYDGFVGFLEQNF